MSVQISSSRSENDVALDRLLPVLGLSLESDLAKRVREVVANGTLTLDTIRREWIAEGYSEVEIVTWFAEQSRGATAKVSLFAGRSQSKGFSAEFSVFPATPKVGAKAGIAIGTRGKSIGVTIKSLVQGDFDKSGNLRWEPTVAELLSALDEIESITIAIAEKVEELRSEFSK